MMRHRTTKEGRRRNPVLADLFQHMDYMEHHSSGLHKICEMAEIQNNYLHPALELGVVERTIPDKPNSRLQKCRTTPRRLLCRP